MTLYQLWTDYTYHAFEEKDPGDRPPLWFRGEPVAHWTEPNLFPSAHHTEKGKPIGDVFPVDVSAVVVNERCFRLLKPYLQGAAQVLPARYKDQELFVLNVTEIRDCLDLEKSKVKRFQTSGRIMRIEEYAFRKELLPGAFLFKIPQEAHTRPYVTDTFKDLIEQTGIRGFRFVPVWQDQ